MANNNSTAASNNNTPETTNDNSNESTSSNSDKIIPPSRNILSDSDDSCIFKWHPTNSKHYQMYCLVCAKYPGTVSRFQNNRKTPPITTLAGTQHRKKTITDHMTTKYHIECFKVYKRESLKAPGIADSNTNLTKMISAQNEKLGCLIGRYMKTVYNDAKTLTLSAWSWPARTIAHEIGSLFSINDPKKSGENINKFDLQYLTPTSHLEFLECIVKVESNLIINQIDECRSLSLRVDGSVDRTQIDKIYILAKIVDKDGNFRTLFMGIGQQTQRGAKGLLETIKATLETHGSGCYQKCLLKMSSFVTDGASINRGEYNGLWALLDTDAKSHGATQNILKIWCAAHRSDLTVKDLSKSVEEVPKIIRRLTNLSTFIRRSNIRVERLRNTAETHGLPYVRLPRSYEVRWAEFTSSLISATLRSWKCLVIFLGEYAAEIREEDAIEAEAHRRFLLDIETLEMLTFLADVYFHITRFQKKLQSDDLNLMSLKRYVDEVAGELADLQEHYLPSGWEETLSEQLETIDEKIFLHGFELNKGRANQVNPVRHCNSTGTARKNLGHLRRPILEKLTSSLSVRFSSDGDFYDFVNPFITFDRSICCNNNLRKVHELLAPDIDLALFCSQFNDICGNPELKKMRTKQLIKHLSAYDSTSSYLEILIVLSRLMVATPHSADVERTISANNLLKSEKRTNIKLATENKYLFIYFNMPSLLNWNQERAVVHWINAKHRRVHNLNVENEAKKSTKRLYFRGVFEDNVDDDCEAHENDNEFSHNDDEQIKKKQRRF